VSPSAHLWTVWPLVRHALKPLSPPAVGDPMVAAASSEPALVDGGNHLEVHWIRRGGHVSFPADFDLGLGAPRGLEAQVIRWLLGHPAGLRPIASIRFADSRKILEPSTSMYATIGNELMLRFDARLLVGRNGVGPCSAPPLRDRSRDPQPAEPLDP